MRELIGYDLGNAARAIAASGLRYRLEAIKNKIKAGEKNVEKVGFETILAVIEGFASPGAEKAIYQFLSGPLEMTGEAIGNLSILDLLSKMDIVFKDSGFWDTLQIGCQFGAEEILDFVYRRFGGAASEFMRMPAAEACALLRFSSQEERRERLWQRWIASGQSVPFAEFITAVQPKEFRNETELIADIEAMTAGGAHGNI